MGLFPPAMMGLFPPTSHPSGGEGANRPYKVRPCGLRSVYTGTQKCVSEFAEISICACFSFANITTLKYYMMRNAVSVTSI